MEKLKIEAEEELSIYFRGHRKVTGIRYVVETLFHYSRQVREVIYI